MRTKEIRTRFAPSPSGFLHVGGARTALFNYLHAKANGGKFILRVEDTDQERSSAESEKIILESLKWLGIEEDEGPDKGGPYGPYRQSERLNLYEKYTKRLLDGNKAYPCFCATAALAAKQKRSKEMGVPHIYDGQCRGLTKEEVDGKIKAGEKYAVRFRARVGDIAVEDLVQGRVKFDSKLIGDFIIVKSDGFPSYNYAVVIDDFEMQISHIIRGVGHLSNTPRQILIHEALELPLPEYAHISEIVGTDKKKLSKRRGATSVLFFREIGYRSDAFVNYMSLLGWYPEDAQEFMPAGELENKFDVSRCSKSPSMFDFFLTDKKGEDFDPQDLDRSELAKRINKKSKLNWLNNRYIRERPLDDVWAGALTFIEKEAELTDILQKDPEKTKQTFDAVRVYLDNLEAATPFMLEILRENHELEKDALIALQNPEAIGAVQAFCEKLKELQPKDPEAFKVAMKAAGDQAGVGGKKLFMPIRAASTGSLQGLELPSLFTILGHEEVAKRIKSNLSMTS